MATSFPYLAIKVLDSSSLIFFSSSGVTFNSRYTLKMRRSPPKGGRFIVTRGTILHFLNLTGRNGMDIPISSSPSAVLSSSFIYQGAGAVFVIENGDVNPSLIIVTSQSTLNGSSPPMVPRMLPDKDTFVASTI